MNSLIIDVPLVTKFWDFDYGTFRALPYNTRIKKIFKDEDGEFTVSATKTRDTYYDKISVEVLNASLEFDYTLTTNRLNGAMLNSSILLGWPTAYGMLCESYRIFVSLFLYNKIDNLEDRQKIREQVHQSYGYNPTVTTQPPLSNVSESEKALSAVSTQNALQMYSKMPYLDILFYRAPEDYLKSLKIENMNPLTKNTDTQKIINTENVKQKSNESVLPSEAPVSHGYLPSNLNSTGQMPFYAPIPSQNKANNAESSKTTSENSLDLQNYVL